MRDVMADDFVGALWLAMGLWLWVLWVWAVLQLGLLAVG